MLLGANILECLKFVIFDSDPDRREVTRTAVEKAGHVIVREAGTLEKYQETLQEFRDGEIEADFFICDRNEIRPRKSLKMRAIGARAIRIGVRINPLDFDILPENRTIESVLAEITELKDL